MTKAELQQVADLLRSIAFHVYMGTTEDIDVDQLDDWAYKLEAAQ